MSQAHPAGADDLLGTEIPVRAATEYAIWHRPTRNRKWRVIGTARTSAAAYALIDSAGHKGGDWTVTALPDDPNVRKPNSAPN